MGYGDLAPSTPAGKLFTDFYIFAGLGIVIGLANADWDNGIALRYQGGN